MLRLPWEHWWTLGLLAVAATGLAAILLGILRIHWLIGALLLWLALGYAFDRTILYRWAGCFHEHITHNVNEASAWFRTALQDGKHQADLHARIGHLSLRQRDYQEAVDHLYKSLKEMPRAVQPRLDLALAYSKLGRYRSAEAYASEALRLAPHSEASRLILAQVRKAAGDLGGAQSVCEEALRERDDSAPAHRLLGETLYGQGNLSQAQRHMQRAVTLDPVHPDGHYWLGAVYLDQMEWLRAQQELTEALNRLVEPTYASDVQRSHILEKLAQARVMAERR